MNTHELQQLKMAWLIAEEAGDKQAQIALLRDHPDVQATLIDFIAAYHATDVEGPDAQHTPLLPLTQRASRRHWSGCLAIRPSLPIFASFACCVA